MSIPKALEHHAKLGHALKAGDHKAAMHQVGHLMAALKHGSPKVPVDKPDDSLASQFPSAPNAPTLRSRLAGMKIFSSQTTE